MLGLQLAGVLREGAAQGVLLGGAPALADAAVAGLQALVLGQQRIVALLGDPQALELARVGQQPAQALVQAAGRHAALHHHADALGIAAAERLVAHHRGAHHAAGEHAGLAGGRLAVHGGAPHQPLAHALQRLALGLRDGGGPGVVRALHALDDLAHLGANGLRPQPPQRAQPHQHLGQAHQRLRIHGTLSLRLRSSPRAAPTGAPRPVPTIAESKST